MPIYEYECEKCKQHFEILQGFSADLSAVCPNCSGKAHRLLSPPSIVFKGSGFHITDYSHSSSSKKTSTQKENSVETKKTEEGSKSNPSADKTETKKTETPKPDSSSKPKEKS